MGNALFLRNQKGDANNVDVLHTLSEMTMARSKIWMILDRTRTNAWWDNMTGNNSAVSEWKENFRLPQPTPGLFSGGILFLVVEATNSSFLTILSRMFPELSSCVSGWESEYPFSVNAY